MTMPLKYGTKTGFALLLGVVAAATFSAQDARAYMFDTLDGQTCAAEKIHIPSSPNLMVFADSSASMREPASTGTVQTVTSSVASDGVIDEGLQKEAGNALGNPESRPGISLSHHAVIPPYAWIANTFTDYHDSKKQKTTNTVSKLDMVTHQEVGRYTVGSDPSRTAVDLDGNAWITGRASGWVTKILWNKSECPDKNKNNNIDTSSGTNIVVNDECVVYHAQPNGSSAVIRGVAAGPDGRVWLGYTDPKGGIQSIKSNGDGFTVSSFIEAKDIPLYKADSSGVFQRQSGNAPVRMGGSGSGANGNYGLVIDSDGILYYAMVNSEYLLAYDTVNNKWKGAYYTPGVNGQYGIAIDAKKRVWLGGWSQVSGVRMFDPNNTDGKMRVHAFPVTPNKQEKHYVTGVAVQPGTGDVWASFHRAGNTGILKFNENNYSSFRWTEIGTTRRNSSPTGTVLPEVNSGMPDLRGVGFDMEGNAWAVGLGSKNVFKLDKTTGERLASVPVGTGEHYTYSDFTGSTALSFTAPSGKWSKKYTIGGKQVVSLTVEGNVPVGTSIGVRYRGLNAAGGVTIPWSPTVAGGTENYHPFVAGQQKLKIVIPQTNDNPFVVDKLQVEVRLSTSDKGSRPYLYAVSMDINPEPPVWNEVQNVAADLSNTFGVAGGCAQSDGTGCDTVRVGLSYFSDGISEVALPGEDTAGAITAGVAGAATGGTTSIDQVTEALLETAQLKDQSRSNFALIVTDGKFNTIDQVSKAVAGLCEARKRLQSPVMTYVMGPGTISDMTMNSLLAAAGGTGTCCEGNHVTCGSARRFDVCDWVHTPAKLAGALIQSGDWPYSQVSILNSNAGLTCTGAMSNSEMTAFKKMLADRSREQACTFALNIPNNPGMYNKPSFPQTGAMPDPKATKVRINHKDWSLVNVPYCKPGDVDCGFDGYLSRNQGANTFKQDFTKEGWYFVDENKRDQVRLTDKLCSEISRGLVLNTRTQVACQCSLQGQSCTVAGQLGRCAVGVYACDEGENNVCKQIHRPMPEVCNGLDDDCDGSTDNLVTTSQFVPDIPAKYAVLECLGRDSCVCPNGPVAGHLGRGATVGDELAKYLEETSKANTGCYCAAGLEADVTAIVEPSEELSESEPSQDSASQESVANSDVVSVGGRQAAGCAVSGGFGSGFGQGSANTSLLFAIAGAFIGWRRRRN